MVGAPDGRHAVLETLLVGGEELGEGVEGECDVLETGGVAHFGREVGDVDEGDTVVLVVVGDEGDGRVAVHDAAAEEDGVEGDHGIELGGAEDDVREFGGGDDFGVGAAGAVAVWRGHFANGW